MLVMAKVQNTVTYFVGKQREKKTKSSGVAPFFPVLVLTMWKTEPEFVNLYRRIDSLESIPGPIIGFHIRAQELLFWGIDDLAICRAFNVSKPLSICRATNLSSFQSIELSICRAFNLASWQSDELSTCGTGNLMRYQFFGLSICRPGNLTEADKTAKLALWRAFNLSTWQSMELETSQAVSEQSICKFFYRSRWHSDELSICKADILTLAVNLSIRHLSSWQSV